MIRGAILVALAAGGALIVALAPTGLGVVVAATAVLAAGLVMRRPSGDGVAVTAPDASAATDPDRLDWLGAVPCGLLLLDEELVVVAANAAALALCERGRDEVVGVSLIRAIRDHNITQVAREGSGTPRQVDVRDGQTLRVTATRLPEPLAGARTVLALEDLTQLVHAQRARSDLVANASHELRTPVTAALALAETLEGGVPDEARREDFQRRLTGEVSRLREIIEGLLNLSRLESGGEEFTIEALDPGDLLATSARRIEPLLQPGQSLELLDESVTAAAGDRERVLEVLANLLDNALRVSPPEGRVTIAAFAGDDEVRFEVRDQGRGVAPRDRSRIFERFYTGDVSRTGARSSGLGLAIARHIVSRLGGRIWVSDRMPGATLCFTLPTSDSGEGGAAGAVAVDRAGAVD